jgi:mRNA-degrading endonuclease toxin of MazEF toxin-antitoxin module
MRDYIPGTIFVADVPFDDRGGTKRRPVVLVGKPGYWKRDNSALVCPITTAQHRTDDVAIDWRAAGLARVSRVRPRPRLLPKADIGWRLGRLTDADLVALKQTLREILDL